MAFEVTLHGGLVAVVDDCDRALVVPHRWHPVIGNRNTFARSSIRTGPGFRTVLMHRLILGLEVGDARQSSHVSGDGLDNRRSNLRIATAAQNSAKRRPRQGKDTVGVRWLNGRWAAFIVVGEAEIYLGSYDDVTTAAGVFNAAAVRVRGGSATLNAAPTRQDLLGRVLETKRGQISRLETEIELLGGGDG